MVGIKTSLGRNDVHAMGLLSIGRAERCRTTSQEPIQGELGQILFFFHTMAFDFHIGWLHVICIGRQTDETSVGGGANENAVDATLNG